MRTSASLFLLLLLAACGAGISTPAQDAIQPATLPPRWTQTPTFTPMPPASPTPTITPTPTLTPYPEEYGNSAWAIRVEGPPGWYGAEALAELHDGSIVAAGPVYAGNSLKSVWVARLTRTGAVAWLRTIPLPENHRLYLTSLEAGLDGIALLSGRYSHPGEGQSSVTDRVMLSISSQDGSIQMLTSLEVRALRPDGVPAQQATLDFGEGYWVPPLYYPQPRVRTSYMLPDQGLLFAGTIEDLVVPGDMIARAGPDPGFTTYWFAHFSPEGSLIWKHFYQVDPLRQSEMHSAVTQDGDLVIAGGKRQRVSTQDALYYLPLYAWVRRVNPDGRTIFHQRYLDLPKLEGIAPTPDGGLLLFGIRYIEQDGNPFGREQSRMVKLDSLGNVEWSREFQEGITIEGVLPLMDGSYVVSHGHSINFARLSTQGNLPGCPDIPVNEITMRVDQEPAEFDRSGQVPVALSFTDPIEEQPDVPPFSLSQASFTTHEICRSFLAPAASP